MPEDDTYGYVRHHYGVPARLGGRIVWHGLLGILLPTEQGHYLNVLFDQAQFAVPLHPTDDVEYLETNLAWLPMRDAPRTRPIRAKYHVDDSDGSHDVVRWMPQRYRVMATAETPPIEPLGAGWISILWGGAAVGEPAVWAELE